METRNIFNTLCFILVILLLTWIISEYLSDETTQETQEKQWVWVELKTMLPRDTSDYFYYGQINKSLIDKVDFQEDLNGLFKLSNIRYWNDDDLLQVYENDENNGYRLFKIQSIQNLKPFKDDPINLFNIDELHNTAIELRDTIINH